MANSDDVLRAKSEGDDKDLSGANLTGAEMFGNSMRGATYDTDTIWPDGFNPEAPTVSGKRNSSYSFKK